MKRQFFAAMTAVFVFLSTTAFGMDVRVIERNGDVYITGDDLPDSILIEGVVDGMVRISGRNTGPFGLWPTLINGSRSPIAVEVDGDLIVDLGEGGDDVEIRDVYLFNSLRSNITLEFGRSADSVRADNVMCSGNFKINMGSGSDVVESYGIVAREVRYLHGAGGAYFHTLDVHASRFEINTGSGDDGIYLANIFTTRLEVFLGSGNDSASLARGIEGDRYSVIDGGTGYDKRLWPVVGLQGRPARF